MALLTKIMQENRTIRSTGSKLGEHKVYFTHYLERVSMNATIAKTLSDIDTGLSGFKQQGIMKPCYQIGKDVIFLK